MGTKLVHWIAVAALAWPATAFLQEAERPASDAQAVAIVEKADLVRFPAEGFEVTININTHNADGSVDPRKYRVLSKGNENSVVMTLEPASERGQIMLMKGHDLWIFLPTVSQPVRLPQCLRLIQSLERVP